VPKIVSDLYELVKLCHINCNGPFFWDTLYKIISSSSQSSRTRRKHSLFWQKAITHWKS